MKKTLAKVLAIALCAVLLVTGTVYITLAYLQSQSNIVKNTFTTSNITLTLDEAHVINGKLVNAQKEPVQNIKDAARVEANEYKLVPGYSYVKDPTVHVGDTSENCFVVIAIHDTLFHGTNVNQADYEGKGCIYGENGQMYKLGWRELTGYEIHSDYLNADESPMKDWGDDYKLYYYAGKPAVEGETSTDEIVEAGEDLVIFEGFTLSGDVSSAELKTLSNTTFEVVAFGMQTTDYGTAFDEAAGDVAAQIGIAFDATFGEVTDVA